MYSATNKANKESLKNNYFIVLKNGVNISSIKIPEIL